MTAVVPVLVWLLVLVLTGARLAVGGLAEAGEAFPSVDAALRTSDHAWLHAVSGAPLEPAWQGALSSIISLATLIAGVVLLVRRRAGGAGGAGAAGARAAEADERSAAIVRSLVALALIATAGMANLSVQSAVSAVVRAAGLPGVLDGNAVLQGVAAATLTAALLQVWWKPLPENGSGHTGRRTARIPAVVGAIAAVAGLVLPVALGHTLVFAAGVPGAGLILLGRGAEITLEPGRRARRRLILSTHIGLLAVAAALLVATVLLWSTGWRGLVLPDPTAAATGPVLLRETALLYWFARIGVLALAGSALVAVRPQGLFVTERHLSRMLVISVVAACGGGVFIVLHTGLVTALGTDGSPVPWWVSAVAAAPPAAALFPASQWIERHLDRLVYGARPAPYSVLAGVGALSRTGPAAATDLNRVTELVGLGLGAEVCQLTVRRAGGGERTYRWSRTTPVDTRGGGVPALAVAPIRLGDDEVGALAVDQDAVAGLDADRHTVLQDIADSLGVVLQASRLGVELERQLRAVRAHATEIALSRRRLVAEMDAEHRRIERDLHDGVQHHLVSLRLSLGLASHLVSTGAQDRAQESLADVLDRIDVAEWVLAQTATGVSSPVLAERGLVGALESELAAVAPEVSLTVDGVDAHRRFVAGVESAVWFSCLEAVNNARKHAGGAAIDVVLRTLGDRLEFIVRDQGPGWDAAAVPAGGHGASGTGSTGRGMRNLKARVAAAGGQVDVESAPGAGTTVHGWVPATYDTSHDPSIFDPGAETVPVALPPDGRSAAALMDDVTIKLVARATGQPVADDGTTATIDLTVSDPPSWADDVRDLLEAVCLDYSRPATGSGSARATAAALLAGLSGPLRVGVAGVRPGSDAATTLDAAVAGVAGVQLIHDSADGEEIDAPWNGRLPRAQVFLVVSGDRTNPPPAPFAGLRVLTMPADALSQLRTLVQQRFTRRSTLLAALAALPELRDLVRDHPPSGGARAVLHRIEYLLANARELAELEALERIRAASAGFSSAEITAAAMLLGEFGRDPRERLGLPSTASHEDVVHAAGEALAHWRRRAGHPAQSWAVRAPAAAVAQSCEQLVEDVLQISRPEQPA